MSSIDQLFVLKINRFRIKKNLDKMAVWDTGGMERVASVTSSYYKFAEGAILVFSLDNASSFHALSQHLLDIVSYAENAKIFLCGNKSDAVIKEPQVFFRFPIATHIETLIQMNYSIFGYRSATLTSKTLLSNVKI